MAKNRIISLEQTLLFEYEPIISRFIKSYNVSIEEAEDIFSETKKFLWLCAICKQERSIKSNIPKRLFIDNSILIIDKMWHNFILFTKVYNSFCLDNFGFFIHHTPNIGFFDISTNDKEVNKLEKYRVQYEYIYEKLGEETLIKWYEFYSDKYSKSNISKLFLNPL